MAPTKREYGEGPREWLGKKGLARSEEKELEGTSAVAQSGLLIELQERQSQIRGGCIDGMERYEGRRREQSEGC